MMRKFNLLRAGLLAGISLSALSVNAQLSVAPQTDLQALAQAISGPGVRISNPVINCHVQGYGEFSYSGNLLGLESGVILTSGRITEAIGPNDVANKTFQQGTSGNALLNTVTGRTTRDACLFEFDVIPSGDSLSFQFVFGSEEYNEWVGSQYNDVFGFFISGPGIVGDPGIGADKNIALIPGTSAPVAINSVNNGLNSAYYVDNAGGSQLQMDGYTTGLVARSLVQPCQTYHLKLIVADASDRKFDSWVFIERIQSSNVSLSTPTVNGTPNMVEGCNPGWIRFTRDPVMPDPLTLTYYLQGTATNGTDYAAIGNANPNVAKTITIPGGAAFAEQYVNPEADAIAEPTEHLRILLGNPNCPGFVIDSIDFPITDTLIASVSPEGTQTICHGSSTQFEIQGGLVYSWTPSTGLSCTTCPNPIASPTTNTNYTVVINEGACVRTVSRLVRVSNPTISATMTQPLCNGGSNGAINITVTGGYAPYTYAWSGPNGFTATSEDLVNIEAGTYTVTVTDNSGCPRAQSFNMGSPAALGITLTPSILPFGQNIACNGASTGTLSLAISGGTGPHAIQWSGPNGFASTQQNLSNIGAGTYNVQVTDANGCTASGSYTMTQSPVLALTLNGSQPVTCFGSANGQATVNASGGMPPYSISWNTSPVQTGATATGLSPGTRTASVTDGYGCNAFVQVTIGEPAAVSVSLSGTSHIVHCQGQGQQNGTATAIASGGTGAFSYSWNTSPVQGTATATFNSGGNYTVTATDANGCTGTANLTVNQPGNISTSILTQTGVSCFGGSNGSATVSVSGGSNIQSATWNTNPVQNGLTALNLPAGIWTLTAQHADGCVTQVPVTIAQPAAALGSSIASQTDVSCFGGTNGSATVSANGGTAPYSYNWNSTPAQSGATATNLAAGSYTCTITDANGCSTTRNVTIAQPAAALSSSISAQTHASCFGSSNGSATVSANGGTSPYNYSWNTIPVQTSAIATGLSAGSYTCTISDANGCTTTRNVTITQPAAALSSSIAAQNNVSCFGGSNGSATMSVSSGTTPYTYSWNTSPAQSAATANNLPAGIWTCTISDANGCSIAQVVNILQPATALGSSITAQSNASCFAGSNGSATVQATGGTGPYSYSWNTIPAQTSATTTDLGAGSYTCTIADANGCTTTRNVTITQPAAALSSSITAQTNVSCFGNNSGSATVNANDGTAPYTYSWNTTPVQSGPTAVGLTGGTWTCTITDA
ncbi:MAG TPA: choice-of-anchor L domain-containing protein, partial [Flavobacteriales bacterium]|nr:choice-of-anchor L domain-containing protein [Flavobacteriales bacterium]